MGDIVLQCSGSPGAAVSANLNVYLPVPITNRVNSNFFATDATLTIDSGSGPVAAGVAGLVTNQTISFSNLQFIFPATGKATIKLTNLRANVDVLGVDQQQPIQASLSSSLLLDNNPVIVAFVQRGLLATISDAAVTCTGSPVPASPSVTSLFTTGTAEQTTRVTEGFAQAFQPKDATTDTGTRILITYASLPPGTTVFVPDAVAGSSATQPTAGGDLGSTAAGGEYTPGSGTLLLVRVLNADTNGAGGTLAALPAPNSSGVLALNSANPVALTNGGGYAVYEVVDANPAVRESAQILSFFGIPKNSPPGASSMSVSLAPVSTVGSASATAPIPRFAAVPAPSDCSALGDCNASYFPHLQVTAQPIQATAVAGGKIVTAGTIAIQNTSGGVLAWQANIIYASGADWIILSDTSGANNNNLTVYIDPRKLAQGTYQATILIDAGPMAGSKSVPVTVTATGAPAATVMVTGVTNAADFHAGPVAPGSFATVWGTNLAGQNVSVTFDGTAAHLIYTGTKQINVRVPPELSGRSSSQVVVTADGTSSAPYTVELAAAAPAIFTPGVLNQDNTVNTPSKPAALGTVLQIFGTGIPDSGGTVLVKIQDRDNLVPLYAGAAPGLPGLQQVNVTVPADLPAMPSNLIICVAGPGNQRSCSQPESIALK